MQSPDPLEWNDPGPQRLIGFTNQELEQMLTTAEGLTYAAIQEVLFLRAELRRMSL